MDARKQELLEARFQGPSFGGSGSSVDGNVAPSVSGAASAPVHAQTGGGISQSSSCGQSAHVLDVGSNASSFIDFSSASFIREAANGGAGGPGNHTVASIVTVGDTIGTPVSQEPPEIRQDGFGQASAALAAGAAAAAAATTTAASLASRPLVTASPAAPKTPRKRRAGPATPGDEAALPAPPPLPQSQSQPKTPSASSSAGIRNRTLPQQQLPAAPPCSLPLQPAACASAGLSFVLSDDSCSSRSSDGAAVSSSAGRRAAGRQRKRQQQQQSNIAEIMKPKLSPVKELLGSPEVFDAKTELASMAKVREDLAHTVASQQKAIESLRECQERSRETIRCLLTEKSCAEKREARNRCQANRLRLGQFHSIRRGTELEEKWFDGWAFLDAHRRRHFIEQEKERIEKERKQWIKRKPVAAGGAAKAAGGRKLLAATAASSPAGPAAVAVAATSAAASSASELDADEFFIQLEVYDIQRQMLIKDEKDLRDETERLDRERNVHIREMKRIQNEESSRFQGNIELHNRYLLLSLLGRGGFSEVHKAYDLTEHRFVACKIHQLNASWPKEKKDNYIRHAVREIEIHKTLHHPRIVEVYDVFDIDCDCFCTVLEYSKGCDLDFYLKQNKSLPEREARNVICQVVSALKYLNQRKPPVIHYDLKPGNILLGEGDSIAAIKLTDFGLSKIMTEDKFQADTGMDLTSPGAGTYWYLPPECFETGSENVPKISSKVDVWSVGVILYQCLYGQKPFGNNMSQADVLRNHTILLHARRVEFPQSTPSNCRVSEQAKNFIRRCVTHDKHLRPDVLQLAEDEYLKSKAQVKFDTSTAASSPVTQQPIA